MSQWSPSTRLLIARFVAAATAGTAALVLVLQALVAPAAAPPGLAPPDAAAPPLAASYAAPQMVEFELAATKYLSAVTTGSVRVRTGPGTNYASITLLVEGTRVKLLKKNSKGWWQVTIGRKTGWMMGSYLKLSTKAPTNAKGYLASGKGFEDNGDKGPNKTSRVVLTYDDCPNTLNEFNAVLKYVNAQNIGLAIAPTGDCISSFEDRYGVNIATLARAKGQWVINHSAVHQDLTPLSCADAALQLRLTGVSTNYGRPPHGAVDGSVECAYESVGMNIWTWDVSTQDWEHENKALTISRAVTKAKRGSTVLMHMWTPGFTPDSIRQIKAGLSKRGLSLCRAYRGMDNAGAIRTTPRYLPDSLPC